MERRRLWLRNYRAFKAIYRPILAALVRATVWVFQRMPRRLALACGELLGAAAYHVAARERSRAVDNLTLAFGGSRPRWEILRIARDCHRTVGRSVAETMRLPVMSEEEIISLIDADPLEPVEKVLARGKGIVTMTGHFGTWELLAAYLAIRLGKPFHAVGRRVRYGPYNDLVAGTRRSVGVETVYRDGGGRAALRILRDNRGLGILSDYDIKELDGVFVDFFGRPAWTPTGPAALARASGAGIVPVFIRWNGRRHRVHILPEVELVRTRDRKADVVENTQAWSRVIEQFIRRHPEQWVWMLRRWRDGVE